MKTENCIYEPHHEKTGFAYAKTKALHSYALGFQHSPRDLANVNEWKIMFDPYIISILNAISLITGNKRNEH